MIYCSVPLRSSRFLLSSATARRALLTQHPSVSLVSINKMPFPPLIDLRLRRQGRILVIVACARIVSEGHTLVSAVRSSSSKVTNLTLTISFLSDYLCRGHSIAKEDAGQHLNDWGAQSRLRWHSTTESANFLIFSTGTLDQIAILLTCPKAAYLSHACLDRSPVK